MATSDYYGSIRRPLPIPEGPPIVGNPVAFLDKMRQATPFAPSPHPAMPDMRSILDFARSLRDLQRRSPTTPSPAQPHVAPDMKALLDFARYVRFLRQLPPGGVGIPARDSSPLQADTYGYHKQRQQQRYQ